MHFPESRSWISAFAARVESSNRAPCHTLLNLQGHPHRQHAEAWHQRQQSFGPAPLPALLIFNFITPICTRVQTLRATRIGSVLKRGISGGQAKRTNVGIALITSPAVLLLDEPTSGLDSWTANEVRGRWRRGIEESGPRVRRGSGFWGIGSRV